MEKPHDTRFGGSNIKISLLPTKKKLCVISIVARMWKKKVCGDYKVK